MGQIFKSAVLPGQHRAHKRGAFAPRTCTNDTHRKYLVDLLLILRWLVGKWGSLLTFFKMAEQCCGNRFLYTNISHNKQHIETALSCLYAGALLERLMNSTSFTRWCILVSTLPRCTRECYSLSAKSGEKEPPLIHKTGAHFKKGSRLPMGAIRHFYLKILHFYSYKNKKIEPEK